MSTLLFILLILRTACSSSEMRGRHGKMIKVGSDAFPKRNKNNEFVGFQTFQEAQTWVQEQFERMYITFTDTSGHSVINKMYNQLLTQQTVFELDGHKIVGLRNMNSRRNVMVTFGHGVNVDENVEFNDNDDDNPDKNWGEYFVKFSFVTGDSRDPDKTRKVSYRIELNKFGQITLFVVDDPDKYFGWLVDKAENAISSAFRVTDFIGDIAESVGMEDVYLQYVIYIFLTVLIGMSFIVILLTALCIKIIFFGNKKKQYKQVATTDSAM